METQNVIAVGNGPDHVMTARGVEYFHRVSTEFQPRTGPAQFRSSSDRSLVQAVRETKQILTPFGWSEGTYIEWLRGGSFVGRIQADTGAITIRYHLVKCLTQGQINELTRRFARHFLKR